MWARKQMNQWAQEASIVAEEKKRKDVAQVTDTNKEAAVSSNQNSSPSKLSSNDSSPWMIQKVETVRKLSAVLSSIVSESKN